MIIMMVSLNELLPNIPTFILRKSLPSEHSKFGKSQCTNNQAKQRCYEGYIPRIAKTVFGPVGSMVE